MRLATLICVCLLLLFPVVAAPAAEIDEALAAIKSVKREGVGNETAAARWKELVQAGPKALPAILAGFKDADATAVNWLHAAVDAIAENETKAGRTLPADILEAFVADKKNDPRGRLLAFEILERADKSVRSRMLPGMLSDPGAGLRREAVAFALEPGNLPNENSVEKLKARLKELFIAAREVDQVETIAKRLASLGAPEPDVIGHLGLITHWELAGPFSNAGMKAFAAPLPKTDSWKEFATGHPRALVDLYTALGKAKGVKDNKKDAVYALCRTVINTPEERPAQLRLASENAIKVFLNGREVFGREEYHHGHKLDQHSALVTLKKGKNEILLKVLQDDLTYNWTVDWHFQCRICDTIGGAVPFTVLTAPKAIPVAPQPEPKPEGKK